MCCQRGLRGDRSQHKKVNIKTISEISISIFSCEIDSTQYLEEVISGQTLRLFIVTDMREDLRLKPRCRREIKNIQWFNIASLPRSLKEKSCLENTGYTSGSFYWTLPFLAKLEQFIEQRESQFFKNDEEELMKKMGLPTEFAGGMKSC